MKKISVMFMHVIKDNVGRFWFFDREKQFIGYMFSDFKRVYPVRKLRTDIDRYFHADNIFLHDEKIYITSRSLVQVIVYDIQENVFWSYENETDEKEYYNTVRHNNQIIFFPFHITKAAHVFDIVTGEFSVINWCLENIGEAIAEHLCQKEGKIYFPITQTNCILQLNLDDFSYKKINLKEGISLDSILIDGEDIWLTQKNTETILCCEKDGEYCEYGRGNMIVQTPYISMASVGDRIVAMAKTIDYIALIDKRLKKINRINITEMQNRKKGFSLFSGYCVVEDKLVLFPWGQELMYIVNCDTGEFFCHEMEISTADYYTILAKQNIYEKQEKDLNEFIEYVQELNMGIKGFNIHIKSNG